MAHKRRSGENVPGQPIGLLPENPHYYLFRGRPAVLITSAEHYGAVINLDFDYRAYLDVLASYQLNYTRIYAGAYVEPEDYFIHDNTLGPKPGRYCLPWARSALPGWPLGGNLFDLDAWNEDYFTRFKDFIAQASQRGIVVEICLFNAMYPDTWERMPLNQANNIQRAGTCACADFQTLKDARLQHYVDAYVRKIVQEANPFDNVILEVCDEPGIHGTPPEEYTPWLEHLVEVIVETEKRLPLRHLIAQQVCGVLGGPGDLSANRRVDVIVGQYIRGTAGAQFGGIQLLDSEYRHKKPIELNETAFYPIWYKGDREAAARVEAWEFIFGGGASFNHLNGLFSTFNPAAAGTNNDAVLSALCHLKDFIGRLEFWKMRPDPGLLACRLPEGAVARGMSEPGRQYVFYIHHSILPPNDGVMYIAQPGTYAERLEFFLAPGFYHLGWVDPASGATLRCEHIQHLGGVYASTTPTYTVDLALRLTSIV